MRTLTLAGSALLLISTAAVADLPKLDIETYRLPNGLQVILSQDHSTPVVAVDVWYHVGSKNERPGRTGFAHLFEHMMFQGSEHQDDEYFGPLQSVGAQINGSTNEDRTNYWEVVPSQHLERALLMESDRMGWLVPAMTEEKFKNQQDVVRNERRQGEGRPYSVVRLNQAEILYPKGHPYDHSVIGSHEDLAAATLDDVKDFFRTYYTPNNATLCLAGDFDPAQAKAWIEEYFGEIPPGPPVMSVGTWVPEQTTEVRVHMQDRVQLPRYYYAWHTAPMFQPGDAELELAAKILGQGPTSRLYKKLVHDTKLAQDVAVYQDNGQVSSLFWVIVTHKPGADPAEVERVLDDELQALRDTGPTAEELERAKNDYEAGFIKSIQRVGSFGGKSDLLNRYNHYVGTPDYMEQDLARYMDTTPATIRDACRKWLGEGRTVFEVQPAGDYAAEQAASVDRATLPTGGAVPAFDVPAPTHDRLDNGLELRVMRQSELPLVQIELVMRAGSANDPADMAGLCDVASSMLLEGTRSKDKFAFAGALEALGTDLDVSTDEDYTVVTMTTLTRHLDESMDLLAEALTTPAFAEAEFDVLKEHRLVNAKRERENANLTATKVTRRLVFGDGHPYAALGSGTAASLEAIGLDDAKAFAAARFLPGNSVLVAVGDVDPAALKQAAQKHLGKWTGTAPAAGSMPEPPARNEVTVYLVDKPGDSQSTISIAHAGVPRNDPDWAALAVANRVLGGFFSSRLNLNLREDKGYTYGVRSAFSTNARTGYFYAGGRVQTEVTAPALTEFMKELEDIHGARPISDEELEFAKNSITLGYPAQFETNGEVAGAVVNQVVFGLPDDELSAYPQEIAAVTAAQANAAGAKYIHPDRVAVIVVGDLSKIEDSVRALNLGPVEILDSEGRPVQKAEIPAAPAGGTGARD